MKNFNFLGIILFLIIANMSISEAYFIKNMGQWKSDILFIGNASNYNLIISTNGIFINQQQIKDIKNIAPNDKLLNKYKSNELVEIKSKSIKFDFINSNISNSNISDYNIIYGKKLDYEAEFLNFESERYHLTNVPIYESITIDEIYTDISIKFYYQDNNIRYDFVVDKQGNPDQIQYRFAGAKSVNINNKYIEINTELSQFVHKDIKTYIKDTQEPISSKFKGNNDIISFDVGKKLNTKIVIDPIIYSSYLNNSLEKIGNMSIQPKNVFYSNFNYYLREEYHFNSNYVIPDTITFADSIPKENASYGSFYVYDNQIKKIEKIIFTFGCKILNFYRDGDALIGISQCKEELRSQASHLIPNSDDWFFAKYNLKYQQLTKIFAQKGLVKISYDSFDKNNRFVNVNSTSYKNSYSTSNAISKIPLIFSDGKDSTDGIKNAHITVTNALIDSVVFASFIPYTEIVEDIAVDKFDNIYIVGRTKGSNLDSKFFDPLFYPINKNDYLDYIIKLDRNFKIVRAVLTDRLKIMKIKANEDGELIVVGYNSQENDNTSNLLKFIKLDNYLNVINTRDIDIKFGVIVFFHDGIFENIVHSNTGGMEVDRNGNIYVMGVVTDKFPIINEKRYGEGSLLDVGIVALDKDLNLKFTTAFGSSGQDWSNYIEVRGDKITIIGHTQSYNNDFYTTPDALTLENFVGQTNVFVTRYDLYGLSIEDNEYYKFNIYPNPSSSYIDIDLKEMNISEDIIIYNTFGQTLISQKAKNNTQRINIEQLPSGIYFIKIGDKVEKFVKI